MKNSIGTLLLITFDLIKNQTDFEIGEGNKTFLALLT